MAGHDELKTRIEVIHFHPHRLDAVVASTAAVYVWNLNDTSAPVLTANLTSQVPGLLGGTAAEFSPNGQMLAVGSAWVDKGPEGQVPPPLLSALFSFSLRPHLVCVPSSICVVSLFSRAMHAGRVDWS